MSFLSESQNELYFPAINDHILRTPDDYNIRSPEIQRSMEAIICERLDTPAIQVPPRAPEIGRLPTPELEPLSQVRPALCACCPDPEASRSTRSRSDKMDNQSRMSQAPQHMGHMESDKLEQEWRIALTADTWH
ncbi:hypothetical protein PG999_004547 [Apiospora kogelbergensis]|uniref:Uncharacterized protein n=1 Tax=Apiospora kogelbergensis TaxID=1337665 RepID=A0AAW0QZL7_9PEZI